MDKTEREGSRSRVINIALRAITKPSYQAGAEDINETDGDGSPSVSCGIDARVRMTGGRKSAMFCPDRCAGDVRILPRPNAGGKRVRAIACTRGAVIRGRPFERDEAQIERSDIGVNPHREDTFDFALVSGVRRRSVRILDSDRQEPCQNRLGVDECLGADNRRMAIPC